MKFNGGAVNNGTVNFNGCVIEGNALMKDIEPIGMVGNDKIQPQIFGAKGDGVADDTKAIRNALRVCNYVHIPNGRYGITQYPARGYLGSNQVGSGKPLENAITIIRDNVTLHLDDDAEIFVKEIVEESETLEGNGFICSIYVLGSRTISEGVVTGYETVKNVTIEGGRFVGNRSMFTAEDYEEHSRENYAGIACSWTEGLTIRNTKITDNSGDALYCVPTWNTVVENIETARNRRCSIGIGCTDGFIVRKCYFHDEKQEYTYQNGNTSTGINNNGIIVLEPEPSVYVPTVENGTERNVLIEDNVYDAKKWTLFFKGNGINLKILRNRIINITNPFLAKGVISLSKAGNPAAAEKTISRYLYIEDNIFEASNLLDYYENTNSSWKDYTFYKLENGKYILLTSKPSDWTTNYEDYYIRQTNFLLNTNSKWDTSKYYEKLGDKKYKLLSTEPSNWSTDYNTYYTKSTNICPAITVTSDEDIHIIGNTFKGLGMCSFYTVSGDVFIKNNFCDWSISLHFSIFNALNANYFITDNDVSCNALLFCSLSSSTKTNSNVVVQNNSISMLSSIFEEGTVFGASMPVATYSIIGNYVENNTIGVFPSPNSPNTLNIIGNTVIAKTTRTAAFNPFGNSNSKRVWNGRLENNIFNFPKSVALVESAAGSTAKLVYKNNIFTDNNNDGNIIPSTSTNVYSDGNLALMVNPKRKTGSSSERPTLTATDVGFPYYDTTLNMPIYWNGSSWVDVNGETIDLQVSDTSVLIGAAADSSKTVSVYYGGSTAPTITVLNSDDSANTWLTATYTLYAPTFVANTYYSAANTQVTTKPSNWETNYMDYFTDAEATIPVAGVPKNEVMLTADANDTSAPRGAKVLITLGDELVIINVVQSY